MSVSNHQIEEAELEALSHGLMARGEYRTLKAFLIDAVSRGRLSARLRAKAYGDLGLTLLQLGESEEARKAFLSAADIRTHETNRAASIDSELPKES